MTTQQAPLRLGTRASPLALAQAAIVVAAIDAEVEVVEIITSGDNLASAFANACEALDLHLESLQKLGKRVPKPKHSLVVESV